jgi:hypothetical protein
MKSNKSKHGSNEQITVGEFCQTLRGINSGTAEEMVQRGLLHFDLDTWRLGDSNNGTTRRLHGKWKRSDNSGCDWHRLIGLDDVVRNDRRQVFLVLEGSKDALAAAEIASRNGLLQQTGIVCALGSGYRPIASELQRLCGRQVLVIGDNDAAGSDTVGIVSRALINVGVEHKIWDWSGCQHKDLYEFVVSSGNVSRVLPYKSFSPLPPSSNSPLQHFNPSTQENREGSISVSFAHFVAPFVVTKRSTGNAKSFDLARAIITTNPNACMEDLNKIHHEWFSGSQLLLPLDTDESKSFQTFLDQLCRVRFTGSALNAACERARENTPPFIPSLDGNVEATNLAALCRELQRDSGTRAFICPVNTAQQFLGLRWPEQARWLLHQLEFNGVLECVDRGAPNIRGIKGKPTMWRYKLPIE